MNISQQELHSLPMPWHAPWARYLTETVMSKSNNGLHCVTPADAVQNFSSAFKSYFCFTSPSAICLNVSHLPHMRLFSATKPQ